MSPQPSHRKKGLDGEEAVNLEPIIVHKLWKNHETVRVPMGRGGHGGGDQRLQDQLFKTPDSADPHDRAAGLRDGAMSILIGVAARKSIEQGTPVKIASLTDLVPRASRL